MKRDYSRLKKIIIGAAAVAVASVGIGAAVQEPPPMQEIEYVVQPGDTLWHIAAAHMKDGQSIEEAIYNIKRDNDMATADISPGQKLIIKIEKPDAGNIEPSAKTKY